MRVQQISRVGMAENEDHIEDATRHPNQDAGRGETRGAIILIYIYKGKSAYVNYLPM
jgi:hypothetical protein